MCKIWNGYMKKWSSNLKIGYIIRDFVAIITKYNQINR